VRNRDGHRSRETILVVEDMEEVRKMICQILEHNGYTVLQAANGVEALQVSGAYRKNIHLVLTDVVMPRMNGQELADEVRRLMPSTRLLFMSGYSEDPMVNPLGRLAVFIAKPFTPVALAQKIREVLDGPVQDSRKTS
jgi:CheY-like chemotaxis protein